MKRRIPVVVLVVLVLASLLVAALTRPQPAREDDFSLLALPRGERVIVLLAHPDDETVGAGGLLGDLARLETPCQFVFLTNGEAFQWSIEQESESLLQGPFQYRAFALERQKEVFKALATLGIKEPDTRFLGYPDGGLRAMYLVNRSDSNPYYSPQLGASSCPFPGASGHPLFAGESVVAELVEIIRQAQPTLIVTHTSYDTHNDHWATNGFLEEALATLERNPLFREPRRLEFLVHRGTWPGQLGKEPEKPLLPPPALVQLGSQWALYPTNAEAEALKEQAILSYGTQLTVMHDYMLSFLRRNELFLQVSSVYGGGPFLEPVADTLWRRLFGGADFRSVQCAWAGGLKITLGTRQANPAEFSLELNLTLFYADRSEFYRVEDSRLGSLPAGSNIERKDNNLLIHLPLPEKPLQVIVSAASSYAATSVDRTAIWRVVLP